MPSVNDLANIVRSRGRGDPPSALSEVFINPALFSLNYLDSKVQFARTEQTIDTILAALNDETIINNYAVQLNEDADTIRARLKAALEDIASNFGVTRRQATQSSGTLTLYRDTDLTGLVTVGVGTKFYSPALDQEYTASDTFNITAMIYDPDIKGGKFTFTISITSVNTGLNTIAGVDQVTVMRNNISGMGGVTNVQPVVGGRDIESDNDLANRIKIALSANNVGTKSGYKFLVLNMPEVKDASVVGAGDALMTRDRGDGGSLDIYVIDPITLQISEVTNSDNYYNSGGSWYFNPTRNPIVNDISTVTPTPSAISKDLTAYSGSNKATDQIVYSADIGIGTTVTYLVNNLVETVQNYLEDDSRKIVGSDTLVKEAMVGYVQLYARIRVLAGVAGSTVRDNVINAVTQMISSLGIGRSLEQSDVIKVITNVPNVDRVDLPLTRFDKNPVASPATSPLNVITASGNEVLRVGTITIEI